MNVSVVFLNECFSCSDKKTSSENTAHHSDEEKNDTDKDADEYMTSASYKPKRKCRTMFPAKFVPASALGPDYLDKVPRIVLPPSFICFLTVSHHCFDYCVRVFVKASKFVWEEISWLKWPSVAKYLQDLVLCVSLINCSQTKPCSLHHFNAIFSKPVNLKQGVSLALVCLAF